MKLIDKSVDCSKLAKISGKNAWKCLKLGELTHLQAIQKKMLANLSFQSCSNQLKMILEDKSLQGISKKK